MFMTDKIIYLKDIEFSFTDVPVLKNVNLSIEKNSFCCFFGPNGGGKTTLLKILLGLIKPDKGEIKIFGNSVEKARKKIGYIPQHFPYDRDFPITTLDFILLGTNSFFFSYQNRKKGRMLLKKMELDTMEKNLLGSLSLGQLQKALIAKALIKDPEILILDEPTAHLDPKEQEKFYQIISSYKNIKTILMVTHDLKFASKKDQKIFLVNRFIEEKLPEQICEHFSLGLYHPLPPKTYET